MARSYRQLSLEERVMLQTQLQIVATQRSPDLGQKQAIELPLGDSFIDVALMDDVRRTFAKLGTDVRPCVLGKVGTELIANDRATGTKRHERQRTGTDPCFEYPSAGEQIRSDDNRAEVFWIDDLRAARHFQNHVGQGGAKREKLTRRSAHSTGRR